MSLRLRLIVAFLLLSVVPLGAMTAYTYIGNVRTLRDAEGREAERLARDLRGGMTDVTARLGNTVEQLMEPTEAVPAVAAPPASTLAETPLVNREVSEALGDVAMLLDKIEFIGVRGRGRPGGGDGRGGSFRGGGDGRGSRGQPPAGFRGGFGPPDSRGSTGAAPSPPSDAPGDAARGSQDGRRGDRLPPGRDRSGLPPREESPEASPVPTAQPGAPPSPGRGSQPPASGAPAPAGTGAGDDRIQIDMAALRREAIKQYVPDGHWERLSPEELRRIQTEVDQRMQGIRQGIEISAAELRKRLAEAQLAAEKKAAEESAAAKKARAALAASSSSATRPETAVPAGPAVRRTTMSGNQFVVTAERDGQVSQANAQVNLPNLLTMVFRPDRPGRGGEVPFFVSKSGELITRTAEDQKKLGDLASTLTNPATPPGTSFLPEWTVATIADPAVSDLKIGIARPVGDSISELRRTTLRDAGFGLACIGLAIVGIVPLSGRLTRNLSRLSEGVHRIAEGDYRARVTVHSRDEIGRLAGAFNRMAEDVERHQRSAVGQERIRHELELGRQIQHDMLPQAPLRLGLTEIKGVSVPAREVGGDFFNYFQVPSGQIALLVGDVSGKGVGAALLMANIQASLRTRLALGQDLAALAREIDVDIEGNTPGPVYATLFVGILDPVTRELRYVNAGHNPQYVLRRDGGIERMVSSGLPIGLLAGRGYTQERVQLAAGDLLFFYTDGCVEAENEDGEMLGPERLEALFATHTTAGTDDLLAHVEAAVARFRGSREPFDDATMMVVRVG